MIMRMSAPLPCSWQRSARPCSAGAAPQPAACRRQHNAAECPPDCPVLPGSDLCQAAMKPAQRDSLEAVVASALTRFLTSRGVLCDTTHIGVLNLHSHWPKIAWPKILISLGNIVDLPYLVGIAEHGCSVQRGLPVIIHSLNINAEPCAGRLPSHLLLSCFPSQ